VEVARADADEGDRLGVLRLVDERELRLAVSARAEERHRRRVEEALPRLGPHGVAEERVVVSALQPVAARVLLVRPAGREVGCRGDLVVDDPPRQSADDR
jgi:hypothetical protein